MALNKGNKKEIKQILSSNISLRLKEMGFLPGKEVEILERGILNGPILVQIEQTKLCLRLSEANLIELNP